MDIPSEIARWFPSEEKQAGTFKRSAFFSLSVPDFDLVATSQMRYSASPK